MFNVFEGAYSEYDIGFCPTHLYTPHPPTDSHRFAQIRTHSPTFANIRTYSHTYIHACTHTCMHAYTHACMHACVPIPVLPPCSLPSRGKFMYFPPVRSPLDANSCTSPLIYRVWRQSSTCPPYIHTCMHARMHACMRTCICNDSSDMSAVFLCASSFLRSLRPILC